MRIGEGPFISGGGFFVAKERGYFKRLGIEIQMKKFNDGALAVPGLVSGELDITLMTANASLFNSIAKGAPLVIILDRGHNRPGYGYLAINVTQELYDQGVRTMADLGKLKGKKIGVNALGSINQYDMSARAAEGGARSAQGREVDHRRSAARSHEDARPEAGRRHRSRLPVRLLRAEQQVGADRRHRRPDRAEQLDLGVCRRREFVQDKRDVLVRFAMAYLQGVKEFNAAAVAPDKHPDVVGDPREEHVPRQGARWLGPSRRTGPT